MQSWWIDAVGVAAGVCSVVSFPPQIWKILRERDASGVSLRTYCVTATAFVLWTIYGALNQSWPLVLANGACLALVTTILVLRLVYGDGPSG